MKEMPGRSGGEKSHSVFGLDSKETMMVMWGCMREMREL